MYNHRYMQVLSTMFCVDKKDAAIYETDLLVGAPSGTSIHSESSEKLS